MKPDAKRITTTAVCVALAVICIVLSAYLPLKITTLLVAAVCFFIAFCGGFVYGLLAIAASLLIAFFAAGINTTFIFTALIFAPYSIFAFALKKLLYNSPKNIALRAALTAVLFNAAFALTVFVFGKYITDYSLGAVFGAFGGGATAYIIVALIGTVIAVVYDYAFTAAAYILNKRLHFIKEKTNKAEGNDVQK